MFSFPIGILPRAGQSLDYHARSQFRPKKFFTALFRVVSTPSFPSYLFYIGSRPRREVSTFLSTWTLVH